MAESKKQKETSKEVSKETLSASLDNVAIKNKQASDISDLQSENKKLKDYIGRKNTKTPSFSQSKIQGLASLRNTLGMQGTE